MVAKLIVLAAFDKDDEGNLASVRRLRHPHLRLGEEDSRMFNWLFGKRTAVAEDTPKAAAVAPWEKSESGNPMMIYRNRRLTVFPSDGGWKFCIAKMEDESPYFSEVYRTEDGAKYEALALVEGRPSQHVTRRHENAVVRLGKFAEYVASSEAHLAGLPAAIEQATTVTDLRKIERTLVSKVKSGAWQPTDWRLQGATDAADAIERQTEMFQKLLDTVQARITELKAKPRGK